jgi:hypothetical protein
MDAIPTETIPDQKHIQNSSAKRGRKKKNRISGDDHPNGQCPLTIAQKAEIKAKWLTGRFKLSALAPLYSIAPGSLYRISKREKWESERDTGEKLIANIASQTYLELLDHCGCDKMHRTKALIKILDSDRSSGQVKINALRLMAELGGEIINKNENTNKNYGVNLFKNLSDQELDEAIKKRMAAINDRMSLALPAQSGEDITPDVKESTGEALRSAVDISDGELSNMD